MNKLTVFLSFTGAALAATTSSYIPKRDLSNQEYPQPNTKRGKFKRNTRNKRK